ncbi:MAG: hypothetical protein L6408_02030 [Nanoarchaeota archaeon]|nr:hypothetical protein [Nanoarchaeota archaeon]
MKNKNSDLEYCIQKLEENTKNNIIDPNVEIYAVNRLKEKKDILKFYRTYVGCMKQKLSTEIKKNKKSHAVKLVDRGYPIQKVAAFFVHDGLMFTLGHIYNQEVLKAWYSVLPHMKRGFPKDMYKK